MARAVDAGAMLMRYVARATIDAATLLRAYRYEMRAIDTRVIVTRTHRAAEVTATVMSATILRHAFYYTRHALFADGHAIWLSPAHVDIFAFFRLMIFYADALAY